MRGRPPSGARWRSAGPRGGARGSDFSRRQGSARHSTARLGAWQRRRLGPCWRPGPCLRRRWRLRGGPLPTAPWPGSSGGRRPTCGATCGRDTGRPSGSPRVRGDAGDPRLGAATPGGFRTRGVRRLAAGILGVFFAVSLSEERAGPHEEPAGVIQGSGRAVAGPWFQFILPGLPLKRPKTLEAGAGR